MAQGFEQLPSIGGDLEAWYNSTVQGIESPIIQGTHFYKKEEQIITPDQNPFYGEGWDRLGKISYEGRQYSKMNIIYNTSEDLLLIRSWEMDINGTQSLLINQTKIDSFIIHSDKFLSFEYAKVGDEGFYRQVMQGKNVGFYSKEKKTGDLDGLIYEFEEQRHYYIRYRDKTYNFKQIPSLYRIFPEHKKQIKKFIKDNFSGVRKDNEALFQLILNHFDLLVS